MKRQAEISTRRLTAKVGKTMIVLVDEVSDDEAIVRSGADAPEIGGQVIIAGPCDLQPGDFVEVKITGSDEHDLLAEPLV
ncbi:TRAM domain-containing protein [Candidatus Vondammii sp. HM_W22]|uniref:TRAM domain-containing protein n=1 Tax=Candidatus Vondammii sp. HM_W22 TaxID=2687299 RepID=UPI001F136522|nr:TRAM domain-containing protein [Candidatus Vondammii sp. HM_W22]